jgi:hypothetical protein
LKNWTRHHRRPVRCRRDSRPCNSCAAADRYYCSPTPSGRKSEVRSSEVRSENTIGIALRPSHHTSPFRLDLASICLDEKDLIGSYSSDFTSKREVARLVFSRRLDVRDLISHSFPLAQTAAAVPIFQSKTIATCGVSGILTAGTFPG